MSEPANLPAVLDQARVSAGLSYGALAERAHASTGSLHRILHGQDRPRRNTLLRICVALNLDLEQTNTALRLARHLDLDSE